jgi:hypothetical protein
VAVAATARKQENGQNNTLQVDNVSSVEGRSIVSKEAADNSRCHVCHIDYNGEEC